MITSRKHKLKVGDLIRIKSRQQLEELFSSIQSHRNGDIPYGFIKPGCHTTAFNIRMFEFCGRQFVVSEIDESDGLMNLFDNEFIWHPDWVEKENSDGSSCQ